MKQIVVTGPESSGKTTLAAMLASAFETRFVPEYARHYLMEKGGSYTLDDLVKIAAGHQEWVKETMASAAGMAVIFIDTWMLELRIWAQYRFGEVPKAIEQAYQTMHPDLYLLCKPDIDWHPDPLRENPHDRDALFEMYAKEIEESGIPYILVHGTGPERTTRAIALIKERL